MGDTSTPPNGDISIGVNYIDVPDRRRRVRARGLVVAFVVLAFAAMFVPVGDGASAMAIEAMRTLYRATQNPSLSDIWPLTILGPPLLLPLMTGIWATLPSFRSSHRGVTGVMLALLVLVSCAPLTLPFVRMYRLSRQPTMLAIGLFIMIATFGAYLLYRCFRRGETWYGVLVGLLSAYVATVVCLVAMLSIGQNLSWPLIMMQLASAVGILAIYQNFRQAMTWTSDESSHADEDYEFAILAERTGDPPEPPRWVTWGCLALILLTGTFARCFKIETDRFWHDEIWSMELAAGHGTANVDLPENQIVKPPLLTRQGYAQPVSTIWRSLKDDIHPPLYYVVLRLWMDIFTWGELSATMLSVLTSVLMLPVFFDLVRRLHGTTAALCATTIMAIAGFQLEYAREARAYAQLMLLVLVAANALVRIEKHGFRWTRGAALALSLAAACLTHYYAITGVAALGLYCLLRLRGSTRLRTVGAFSAAGLIVAIVWGPVMLEQMRVVGRGTEWMTDRGPGSHTLRVFRGVGLLPSRMVGPSHTEFIPEPPISPQLIMGLILLVPFIGWRRRPEWQLWGLLLGFAIALPLFMDLTRHSTQVFAVRFAALAAAPLYALLCTISRRPWLNWTFRGLTFFAAVSAFPYAVWPYAIHDFDFRGAGRYLDRESSANDVILFAGSTAPEAFNNAHNLMLMVTHQFSQPRDVLLVTKPITPEIDAQLRKYPKVWIHVFFADIPTIMPGWKIVRTFGTKSVSAGIVYEVQPIDKSP